MNWDWMDFRRDVLFWGNTAGTVCLALGLALAVLIGGAIVKRVLKRISKRLHEHGQKLAHLTVEALVRGIPLFSVTLALTVIAGVLNIPEQGQALVYNSLGILYVVVISAGLYSLVEVPVLWFSHRLGRNGNGMEHMIAPLVRKTLRVTIFVLAAVQVVQILSHQPVTSILAGLGVGGLAVALAAQETVKNFFGSLVLATDRPFEIGDRIVVDGFDGPVESVGMRSTRIRTLEGHLVTIPNGELANKNIKNISKRPHIRNLFNVGVTYDTSPEKMRRAVAILEELLKDHEGMDPELPPRVTFTSFGDWSLNIQVIYWYHPPDYWAYMAFTQNLNLQILERFNAEGIEFAFPTQTQNVPKGGILASIPEQQPPKSGDARAKEREAEQNNNAAAAVVSSGKK